ncbi:MAG: hypothetical protein CVU97_05280 [Firmicutes bacterium HGW-Firmicutes-21]|nr:MAG: hypothetical protein CVU97_05280 [Firmicutes bacterium HGW-Firmicutes-21]
MDFVKRKQIRLQDFQYKKGCFFITICSNNRLPLFGDVYVGQGLCSCRLSETGKIVKNELLNLPLRYPYIIIRKYCVMPDHIHFIIDIIPKRREQSPRPTSCAEIICAYKSVTTKKANAIDNKPGRKIWQSRYFDRSIRNIDEYNRICAYIDENPQKWKRDELHY